MPLHDDNSFRIFFSVSKEKKWRKKIRRTKVVFGANDSGKFVTDNSWMKASRYFFEAESLRHGWYWKNKTLPGGFFAQNMQTNVLGLRGAICELFIALLSWPDLTYRPLSKLFHSVTLPGYPLSTVFFSIFKNGQKKRGSNYWILICFLTLT